MGSAERSQEGDKEKAGRSKGEKNENMDTKGDEKGRSDSEPKQTV